VSVVMAVEFCNSGMVTVDDFLWLGSVLFISFSAWTLYNVI